MPGTQPSAELDQTTPAPAALVRGSLNVPNLITVSRFVLAIALFVLIDATTWWRTASVVFVIAALTDFLDGYLARKYGQVTVVGRVLDPFVDKIIICGSFIFLQQHAGSGVSAWITFVIIARELLITTLRALLEQQGRDFSAKWSGKIKMGVQCAAVPACLLSLDPQLSSLGHLVEIRNALVLATVGITVYSGLEYTWRALRMLAEDA